jgi:F0F1-type ATP synthase assembly protein I
LTKRGSKPGAGDPQDAIRASSEFIGHGMSFAASTLLFLLGGHWLDGKVGTSPVFALLGMFLGAGAGFWSLYSHVSGMRTRPIEDDDGTEQQ